MTRVSQFLWFAKDVEEAVRFYTATIPGSRMGEVVPLPVDTPSGPAGSVKVVEFTLGDQRYTAMEAGPLDPFNHSFSILVECDTQDEIDRLWAALGEGGAYEECGWLRDRYGLNWQIAPRRLTELMNDKDRAKAKRVALAMMTMQKLDLAAIEAAAR
ncbi:MAG: VOC family protein [Deltaproteobacteria bacterium]|nr:VOC family protein [Deltaproteobacteria bacterium]